MKLFTNCINYLLSSNLWLMLVLVVVVLIIGLIIVKREDRKIKEEANIVQFPNSMKEALQDMSLIDIVAKLELVKYPTINIYWNPSLKVDLHNTMVNLLVVHLLEEGFRFCMPDDEVVKMEEWRIRILVIDVYRKVYFFHGDPFEDRAKTVAYEILTNDINQVVSEIDNRIILMQGLDGGE